MNQTEKMQTQDTPALEKRLSIVEYVLNGIAILLLIVGLYLGNKRYTEWRTSVQTHGKVVQLQSTDATCGNSSKSSGNYPCTKFKAVIEYQVSSSSNTLQGEISAGEMRGHNQPISKAEYNIGATVPVRYVANQPEIVFEDNMLKHLALPIALIVLSILEYITVLAVGYMVRRGRSSRS
jgi:hypothetical protein